MMPFRSVSSPVWRSSAVSARRWPPPAAAQFFAFGQNKIQYRKLDWRVMRGRARRSLLLPGRSRARPGGAGVRRGELRYALGAVRPRGRFPDSAHRIRVAHGLRADQHPAVHAHPRVCSARPISSSAECRCPSRGTSPSFGTRSVTRWSTSSSSISTPRATIRRPARAESTSRCGGRRDWPSSGRRTGRARRDGDARSHIERPPPVIPPIDVHDERDRRIRSAGRSIGGWRIPMATGGLR